MVTPCAHLFCLDCIALDKQACPSCRKPYVMQSTSEPARLENNPNPKWDVPMEVIEWQPAYTQKVSHCICLRMHSVCLSVYNCRHDAVHSNRWQKVCS